MNDNILMIYLPPKPISESSSKKIKNQRKLQKKGSHLEYFLVYKDEKNKYVLAVPNEEGIYEHFHKLENRDMILRCKSMQSLEIYIFETATLEQDGKDIYQFVYDGKLISSHIVYKTVRKLGFRRFLTDAVKCYYEEKGYI